MLELDFDIKNVQTTEFGVGRIDNGDRMFKNVPVDQALSKNRI